MNNSSPSHFAWIFLLGIGLSSQLAAKNNDFESFRNDRASPSGAPATAPAWDQAGLMAGQGASEVSDSLGAAGDALGKSELPENLDGLKEHMLAQGKAVYDSSGKLIDPATGKRIRPSQLNKTLKQWNKWTKETNKIKQKNAGLKDKLGKAGQAAGMMDKAGVYGTGAGEIAGGDVIGGTGTFVNDRLSDGVKAGGAWAGTHAGAAVGGAAFGPAGAVIGGVAGGAYGAWKGGKVYDEYGKPVVDAGLNKGAETYYGDRRGSDAQGRADINAEKSNWTPEMIERVRETERMQATLTPEAFEVWRKVWGRNSPKLVRPPSPDDLKDVDFQKALTKIKVGIWESNRDHPNRDGSTQIDPDGKLASAEKAVLDRIAQLEKDVEWEVGKEQQARREWDRQQELARLREEQEQIAAERDRRARDAAAAQQALEGFGAILGAIGQGMSQQQQQSQPMGTTHQQPTQSLPPGSHRRPDGTIHQGGN